MNIKNNFTGFYNSFPKAYFMKKVLIVGIVIIIGIGGFLGWDWYDKTQRQTLEPSITLYHWTDVRGNKHFSDTPPPEGAKNIYKEKGFKHIEPPLIMTMKDKTTEFIKKTKTKLFGKKKEKRTKE
jgi:Domain of unknown function (DUF4124)